MMLSEETSAVRPQKQTRFNGAKLVWMLKGSPLTVTGAVIIVLMLLMMIFSPWLATHDPNAIDLTARLLPPSAAHWFGTDEVGRDLFSRVLVGSQQSILAGLVVVAIAGMIGSVRYSDVYPVCLADAQTPSSCASWTLCCRFLRWY